MYKGTITPGINGNLKIEMKKDSGGFIGLAVTLGIAALSGAAAYAGQVLAANIHAAIEERKKRKKGSK